MSSKRYQRDAPGKKRQRQSVASLVKTSVQGQKKSQRKPCAKSRSFAPSPLAKFERQQEARGVKGEDYVAGLTFFDSDKATSPSSLCLLPALDSGPRGPIIRKRTATTNRSSSRRGKEDTVDGKKPKGFKVERKPKEGDRDGDNIPDWLEDLYDNSDRHAVGMGLLQRIFGSGSGKRDIDFKEDRDSRPFFTYWVTIIQIIIFIVCIATYGVAPIGIDKVLNSENVLMTTLAIEQVSVLEETNMWIGLRQDDLIHVGAKYSPCMRVDANLEAVLAEDRALDNQTACCIYNDGSGCVQTLEKDCSKSLATWYKWSSSFQGYQNRTSGSVCGLDPKYCSKPASTGSDVWPDDLTRWPTCETPLNATPSGDNYHMTCEVVGRPCCVGMQGQCVIATKEYCDFRRGYYHQEAATCSQVSCMDEVCGLFPFVEENKPDQFYRLFTSLFMHAGVVDLVINVVFQLLFMRDLEKIISTWRVVIIYFGSGVAGSLASAVFVPYHVETGPTGSQFGIIASLFVEIIRLEKGATNRLKAAGKMIVALTILFLIGMILPQVDNWAHMFGLVFGWLLSMGLKPYQYCGDSFLTTPARGALVFMWLVLAAGLFTITVILFYVVPVYDCEACMYFSCIPFTSTYCDSMRVNITRDVAAIF